MNNTENNPTEQVQEDKYVMIPSTAFKKDKKRLSNQPKKLTKVEDTLNLLKKGGVDEIPKKMKPHQLIGEYNGFLECHIEPDLLLIWEQIEEDNIIFLDRLGSHAELFG